MIIVPFNSKSKLEWENLTQLREGICTIVYSRIHSFSQRVRSYWLPHSSLLVSERVNRDFDSLMFVSRLLSVQALTLDRHKPSQTSLLTLLRSTFSWWLSLSTHYFGIVFPYFQLFLCTLIFNLCRGYIQINWLIAISSFTNLIQMLHNFFTMTITYPIIMTKP